MTAIIIDDEARCISALRNDLTAFCPEVDIIETCQSAKDGLLAVQRLRPDVLFLDVEMPWMNGFELLEALGDARPQVVFTTAYDQFAIRALRMSAADYLLKPIDRHDLTAAIARVTATQQAAPQPDHIGILLQNLKQGATLQKIAVPLRDGYEFVPVEQIVYCRADGAYTNIVVADGRRYVLSRSLSDTEQQLPEELFVRIHQSYLVNVGHVGQFRKGEGALVVMSNGDELAVSKARRDSVLQRLGIRRAL